MSRIAIIGAGAWGTALSIVLGRKGRHHVWLWAYEKEVREAIVSTHANALFLPEQQIPDSVVPTGSLEEALTSSDIVVSAMPSQHCRRLFHEISPHLKSETLVVSATKGLEQTTFLRMTEVIGLIAGERGAYLRGWICGLAVLPGDTRHDRPAVEEFVRRRCRW